MSSDKIIINRISININLANNKNVYIEDNPQVIAIGASTGGPDAISTILKELPKDSPGIVIVQHMPPIFTKIYAENLNRQCIIEVKEAIDGDMVEPGKALIVPGGYYIKIKKENGKYFIEYTKNDFLNRYSSAVDTLFKSVAENVGQSAIGIILTGAGDDGVDGLLEMRNVGAFTLAQDEASSIVYEMPKIAFERGAAEKQLPLNTIAKEIMNMQVISRGNI